MAWQSRKQALKPGKVCLVLPGKTELRYFSWMNTRHKWGVKIRPRYAGSEHPEDIEKRVDEILHAEGRVVVVYDEDVPSRVDQESVKFKALREKYRGDSRVSFYSSMPSIELWFLLHFVYTSRSFQSSKEVVKVLDDHLRGYDKKDEYLRREGWLEELDARLDNACAHARCLDGAGAKSSPFSRLYLLIERLEKKA